MKHDIKHDIKHTFSKIKLEKFLYYTQTIIISSIKLLILNINKHKTS